MSARQHEERHVVREPLRHATEGVLRARPALHGEHSNLAAVHYAAVPVRHVHARALLPRDDGPYALHRNGVYQRLRRKRRHPLHAPRPSESSLSPYPRPCISPLVRRLEYVSESYQGTAKASPGPCVLCGEQPRSGGDAEREDPSTPARTSARAGLRAPRRCRYRPESPPSRSAEPRTARECGSPRRPIGRSGCRRRREC